MKKEKFHSLLPLSQLKFVTLMTLSVWRIYSVDVGMINECGAVDGKRMAGETEVLGENPPQ
jgi:hypothetical protein